MELNFEWVVLEVSNSGREVLDHNPVDSFTDARRFASESARDDSVQYVITLACGDAQGYRSRAYVRDMGNGVMMLPKYTTDPMDKLDVRIPVAYQAEVWDANRNPS